MATDERTSNAPGEVPFELYSIELKGPNARPTQKDYHDALRDLDESTATRLDIQPFAKQVGSEPTGRFTLHFMGDYLMGATADAKAFTPSDILSIFKRLPGMTYYDDTFIEDDSIESIMQEDGFSDKEAATTELNRRVVTVIKDILAQYPILKEVFMVNLEAMVGGLIQRELVELHVHLQQIADDQEDEMEVRKAIAAKGQALDVERFKIMQELQMSDQKLWEFGRLTSEKQDRVGELEFESGDYQEQLEKEYLERRVQNLETKSAADPQEKLEKEKLERRVRDLELKIAAFEAGDAGIIARLTALSLASKSSSSG